MRATAHVRRVLAPLGTVAIHLAASPADALSQRAGHLLLLHGFTAVRVFDHDGETLTRAGSRTLDALGVLLPGVIRAEDEAAGLPRLSLVT